MTTTALFPCPGCDSLVEGVLIRNFTEDNDYQDARTDCADCGVKVVRW